MRWFLSSVLLVFFHASRLFPKMCHETTDGAAGLLLQSMLKFPSVEVVRIQHNKMTPPFQLDDKTFPDPFALHNLLNHIAVWKFKKEEIPSHLVNVHIKSFPPHGG